jgi:WD40 repeat protein
MPTRLEGLIIDNEIQLNSGVKCCSFDPMLEVGIVATRKNTLWYVNWREENSVRLVSSHTGRINSVCCIEDRFLATVSDDGSLNIWSLSDRERLVQFEVKAPVSFFFFFFFFFFFGFLNDLKK